jgi:alpha-L-rhamnosidase
MLTLIFAAPSAGSPTGLLCDYQKDTALGVRAEPRFSWVVPPCAAGPDHRQAAFRLTVSTQGRSVWDSSKVASNNSIYVKYAGRALEPGTPYQWSVTTWTAAAGGGAACKSDASAPVTFVTSLFDGFSADAQFISVPNATFGYFTRHIAVPSDLESASAFVTALNDDPLLAAYKLYVNGALVDVGPGRGEAPVWEGDGKFRNLPYATLDVTAALKQSGAGGASLAVQACPY